MAYNKGLFIRLYKKGSEGYISTDVMEKLGLSPGDGLVVIPSDKDGAFFIAKSPSGIIKVGKGRSKNSGQISATRISRSLGIDFSTTPKKTISFTGRSKTVGKTEFIEFGEANEKVS